MGLLIHSQTTNFRLFQPERASRRQFEESESGRNYPRRVENTGKRRNCSLQAISPFPTLFSKDLVADTLKKGLIGKGLKAEVVWYMLNLLPDDKILDWSKLKKIADDIFKCI